MRKDKEEFMMNSFYQTIKSFCEEHIFSGVIRITHKNNILCEYSAGYSDWESKKEFDKNSMFTFYSLSKPFCTIGLMKLVEKGLVDLDAHPGVYVPEAKDFDARVKIAHLLHHVSGLPDFEQNKTFFNKYAPAHHRDLRRHLKLLTEYPMNFIPGTGNMYANVNFVISALIIENVSGKSYADYMKQEVFLPLGMQTAVVDQEGLYIKNRVKGYTVLDNGDFEETPKSFNWMFGGGDIVGTLDDVYCLNKAIKNKLLLTEKSWESILSANPINKMGKGCFITEYKGKTLIRHNGGHPGFRTLHAQILEDDFDIILMLNCDKDYRMMLLEKFLFIFLGAGEISKETSKMDVGYVK